jgi:hypothetical protein
LALAFVRGRAANTEENALAQSGPWHYGYGEIDPVAGRVVRFQTFRHFAPVLAADLTSSRSDAWQAASLLPDVDAGNAHLTAGGGAPGDDLQHPRHAVA